jgi:hypothetical protein
VLVVFFFGEEISATLRQWTPKSMRQCDLMALTDPLNKEQNNNKQKESG